MRYIVILGLLILALLGLYYFMPDAFGNLPNTGANTPATTTGGSQTRTYSSDTYDISFQYPASYALREDDTTFQGTRIRVITLADSQALESAPQNGEGPPSISVSISSTTATSTESWIRTSAVSNFALSTATIFGTTTIDGVQALTYESDGLYATNNVVLLTGGRAYHFSVGWITRQDEIISDFQRLLSTIDFQ
jgi:hypothetical protein